jgi:hypothetical protein
MPSILSATDAEYTQLNGNLKILLRFSANLKIKNIGSEQVQAKVLSKDSWKCPKSQLYAWDINLYGYNHMLGYVLSGYTGREKKSNNIWQFFPSKPLQVAVCV